MATRTHRRSHPAGTADARIPLCSGLRSQSYPPVLLCATEHDSRVPYTQALRYAARMRDRAPESSVLLHLASSGGHAGEGGRFRRLEQAAMEHAFFALALGLPDLRSTDAKLK